MINNTPETMAKIPSTIAGIAKLGRTVTKPTNIK